MSGHGNNAAEGEKLTVWKRQTDGFVRVWIGRDRVRGTHSLETADGRTCQDMEKKPLSRRHSPTEDGRWRDLSRHGKKTTMQGHTLSGDGRGSRLLGHRTKSSE